MPQTLLNLFLLHFRIPSERSAPHYYALRMTMLGASQTIDARRHHKMAQDFVNNVQEYHKNPQNPTPAPLPPETVRFRQR